MVDKRNHGQRPARMWYRPMVARRPDEPYRTVTPLELLFDLCSVVAVRQTGDHLHRNLAETDVGQGIGVYPAVFFAFVPA